MSTAKKLGAPLELSPLDNPVARARRSLHLSQADFGRLIRATGQAVSQWETGVNKIPGPVEL
ncbi:MAG: hypothetical protein LBD82_05930, partial [Deltaproteobacteria bacterium]|nr:hypothetical protein [Deltaproteobacteria bacterium]